MFFRILFCCSLLGWGSGPTSGWAQTTSPTRTSQSLAADTSQLILSSGKLKSSFFFDGAPGNGYALRFTPPAAGPHRLASVCLHFGHFGDRVAKGQMRLRIASVAATGGPADDNLLAQPLVITTSTLQSLDHPLTLAWTPVPMPANGFFVVVEGLGDAPDEYVLYSPSLVLAGAGNYQVVRRSQPGGPPRLLSLWSIPTLQGAKPASPEAELWTYGGDQTVWKTLPVPKRVPLLEVGLQ